MSITLAVLAAGRGSRYGGLKQLEAVGPAGETILDYAVRDAARAGFGRVVFVIRRSFAAEFAARVGAQHAGRLEVAYAMQDDDDLPGQRGAPAARTRPWGTGHAVWCARREVRGPFAVVNADDFYGAEAFAQLARFLQAPPRAGRPRHALVGYRLDQTLSEHGAVARGLCQLDTGGGLQAIVEETGIVPAQVGPGRRYAGDSVVSMNCWGFTPELFPALEEELAKFIQDKGQDPTAEFYLPAAVSHLIATGAAEVEVLRTNATWFGVTYREDKPRVVAALRALAAEPAEAARCA